MTKIEIDLLINILNHMITYAITVKPELANNKVIVDIQSAIAGLQALGL